MIRRPLWLGAGVALGVGGTLWAEQRVRRRIRQLSAALTPAGAVAEVRHSAGAVRDRVRDAVDEARLERRRREAELWAGLEPRGALGQHR